MSLREERGSARWVIDSLTCSVYSAGQWNQASIVDISLTGIQVRGAWNRTEPVTAIRLKDDQDRLVIETTCVWVNEDRGLVGLRFVGIDSLQARRLFQFLRSHLAGATPA